MSYVRWSGGSDVYVYEHVNGGWVASLCGGDGPRTFGTPGACADYLAGLKTEGRKVPSYVIEDLRAEQIALDRPPSEPEE